MSGSESSDELQALTDLFRRRLLTDRASATAIAGLQEQNDELVKQASGRALLPFLRAARRIVERLSDQIASESGEGYSFAESVLDEFLDAITLLDIDVVSHIGALAPEQHNAVAVSTADVAEPTVLEIIRPGFQRGGVVLVPADVVVAIPEER